MSILSAILGLVSFIVLVILKLTKKKEKDEELK